MKFNDYTHFKNYCYAIARNKTIKLSKKHYQSLDEFEDIYRTFTKLKDESKIILEGDMLHTICEYYKKGKFDYISNVINDLTRAFRNFNKNKLNFYSICTSISTKLNVTVYFDSSYITKDNINDRFFPERIRVFEIHDEETEIYPLVYEGVDTNSKYGVYFIFDEYGEIAYIGKSTVNVKRRALASVVERGLSYFNKIIVKTTNKSDAEVYEKFYISKYKPYKNKDGIYEDNTTILLPELNDTEIITKDKDNPKMISYTYVKMATHNTLDIVDHLGKKIVVRTPDSIEKFDKYLDKFSAKNKAIGEFYASSNKGDFMIEDLTNVASIYKEGLRIQ